MKAAALVMCTLCGCVDDDDLEYKEADKTPAGYHVVYHDAGLLASGLASYADVLAAFDAAMFRSAVDLETRFGVPRGQTLSAPFEDDIVFILVDHVVFDAGGTLATGRYEKQRISVAMHLTRPAPLTPASLPWTVYTSQRDGKLYHGILDLPNAFPALSHEFGHHYFGPGFEH